MCGAGRGAAYPCVVRDVAPGAGRPRVRHDEARELLLEGALRDVVVELVREDFEGFFEEGMQHFL